jgi:hypothetical protein
MRGHRQKPYVLNLMMLLDGYWSFWSISMSFLSINVVLSSAYSFFNIVFVRCANNGLFGSDLDAWTSSKKPFST